MIQSSGRSVEELRRETEATRAGLTRTVEELRDAVGDTTAELKAKIQPEAIKAEVSNYIRGRSETLLRDITDAAQRNPVQALAIGASLAFPMLRVARAIPLPVLMIGAGMFLSSTKKGRELAHQASETVDDVMSEAGRRVHDARDSLSEAAADMKASASDAIANAKNAAHNLQQRTGDVVASATSFARSSSDAALGAVAENAGVAKSAAAEALQSVADRTRHSLNEAASVAAGSVESSKEAGSEFLKAAGARLSASSERAERSVRETIEQNPLIVAGVGLLIGGLLAGAFPRSETEDRLVGDASERVKAKAKTAAGRGIEAVKSSTNDVLDRVAERAQAEGLTAENLQQSVRDIGNKVKAVAERATSAALDSNVLDEQSSKNLSIKNGGQHG